MIVLHVNVKRLFNPIKMREKKKEVVGTNKGYKINYIDLSIT